VGTSGTGPAGRRGRRPFENLAVQPTRNSTTVINGRTYTGHVLDQMQNRGVISPSVIENAIRTGTQYPGRDPGTTLIVDPINRI